MTGTKAGAAKAVKTNKKKHGEDFYREIGRKGGSVKTPTGGFAADRNRAREAGRKGGSISRRGPSKKQGRKEEQ